MNNDQRTISSKSPRRQQPSLTDDQLTTVLSRHTSQQLGLLDELEQLLNTERNQVKGRQLNDMQSTIHNKQRILDDLKQGSRQRWEWLLQYHPTAKDRQQEQVESELWNELLIRLGNSELQDLWALFSDRLSEVRDSNEINGKLISRGQQTMKRLLNIMRGQSVAPVKLYNQSGGEMSSTESHTSIKC